jgi:YD repeat-containing protein
MNTKSRVNCTIAYMTMQILFVFATVWAQNPTSAAASMGLAANDRDFSGESLFSGDASASVPIAQIGGIPVVLHYCSNVHKAILGNNHFQQSGWVGLGWALNLASITADIGNTKDTTDDQYYFVSDEVSTQILLDSDNAFKMKHYQYWKISRCVDQNGFIRGWTVIKDDGTIYRFGNYNKSTGQFVLDTGITNATRFMLGLNGLVSNPSYTSYASMQYIPYQWDLSDIQDIYGNHTTICYQQEKDMLKYSGSSTSLLYTRTSYPASITDRTGQTVQFILKDISSSEYENPYETPTTKSCQFFYQTKCLDSVKIKSTTGKILKTIKFNYVTSDKMSVGQTKRYLDYVLEADQNGATVPKTSFDYFNSGDKNPGALKRIVRPEGGSVNFAYSFQALSNVTLNASYGWSGDFCTYYPVVDGSDSLGLGIGTDFCAVPVYYAYRGSGTNIALTVYRWNPQGWALDTLFPYADNIISGFWAKNDYIIIRNWTGSLQVCRRNGDGWSTYAVPASGRIIGTGNDYFLVGSRAGNYVNVIVISQVNGDWQSQSIGNFYMGSTWSPRAGCGTGFFALGNYGPLDSVSVWRVNNGQWTCTFRMLWGYASNEVYAGRDYFVVADQTNERYEAYKWNGTTWQSCASGVMDGGNGMQIIAQSDFFACAENHMVKLYTWSGGTSWTMTNGLSLTNSNLTNCRIAAGQDYVVLGGTASGVGYLYALRLRNNGWNAQTIDSNVGSTSVVPTANATTLFALSNNLYSYADKGSSWLKCQIGGSGTFALAGRDFVARYSSPYQPLCAGGLLLLFKQATDSILNPIFSSSPGDFPLAAKTLRDSMGNGYTTSYAFQNGVYDNDVTFAEYNKSTVYAPAGKGRTVSYFYNHLTQSQCEEYVQNSNYTELDGYMYTAKVYDSLSVLKAKTTNTWSVYQINPGKKINYRRLIQSVELIDGVERTTQYAYNISNGLISGKNEHAIASSDLTGSRDRATQYSYAFEETEYSSMQYLNMLAQPYETKTLAVLVEPSTKTPVILNPSVSGSSSQTSRYQFTVQYPQRVTVTNISCTTVGAVRIGTYFQGCDVYAWGDSDAPDTAFQAWPGNTYFLEASINPNPKYPSGSAEMTVRYYVTTETVDQLLAWNHIDYDASHRYLKTKVYDGTNWITSDSVASRDNYGNILESENVDKVRTTTKYGYGSTLPIAVFANASNAQTIAAIFDDGDVSSWVGYYGTWTVENGAYRQTNGTISTPWDNPCQNTSATVDDGVFEADVRFDNSGTYRYACIVKYLNGSNFVRFELRKSDSKVRIHACKGGTYAFSDATFTFVENKWYHLRGEIEGSTARLYMDGQLYITFSHSYVDHGAGKIGLGTYCTVASFDNVRMYSTGALATSTTYDSVTLQKISTTGTTGTSTFYDYDGFGRPAKTRNADRTIISQQGYYYSRDGHSGFFSSTDPNFVETATYPQGLSTDGLVGYWRMESNAVDEVNNVNAALSTITPKRGYIGSALSFNGSAYSYAYNNQPLNDAYKVARPTVEAWVKLLGTTGNSQTVICASVSGAWADGRGFYIDITSGGIPRFVIGNTAGWKVATGSTVLQTGTWYHLAGVDDGSYVRIYVNGVQDGSTNVGSISISYDPRSGCGPNPSTFYFGIQHNCNNTGPTYLYDLAAPFNGIIDEVRIYNRALNGDEILSHYNPSTTIAFADGLGRTLQSQTRDGANDLISAIDYDPAGRQYRTWRTFSWNTGHAYDASFASQACSSALFNISNPFTESAYESSPLSRLLTTKPIASSGNGTEYINYEYGSQMISGQPCTYVQAKRLTASYNYSTYNRTYADRLGRALRTEKGYVFYSPTYNPEMIDSANYSMLGQPYRAYDPRNLQSTCTYDFLGRVIQKKDPDEGTSKYMYDRAGRLRFMADSLGLAQNNVLYWKYDALGRVVEKGYISSNWGNTDLQNNINNQSYPTTPQTWRKKYHYDWSGRLDTVYTNNDNDNTAEVEEYFTYDKYGNIAIKGIKVIDYNPSTTYNTSYSYDLLGRVTKIAYPPAAMPMIPLHIHTIRLEG